MLEKKTIKEEKINKLVEDFIFNLIEMATDKHIMIIIKSDKKLAEIYNEFVDIYMHYKGQIDKKQNSQEEIVRIEQGFKKEIESISDNSNIMEKIEGNDKLTSFYNRLVDLYNSYKKKEELYAEIQTVINNVKSAKSEFEASSEMYNYSLLTYKSMLMKMENGLANSTDYELAKQRMTSAKVIKLKAKYTYIMYSLFLDFYRNGNFNSLI